MYERLVAPHLLADRHSILLLGPRPCGTRRGRAPSNLISRSIWPASPRVASTSRSQIGSERNSVRSATDRASRPSPTATRKLFCIHPGYGLLSENANFAEVCETCNIKFIGPSPEVIRLMGEKEKARAAMKKSGVPILPGSEGVLSSEGEATEWAKTVGFPVIIKASAGGGGRGMRIIRSEPELPLLYAAAQAEAAAAFGNGDPQRNFQFGLRFVF